MSSVDALNADNPMTEEQNHIVKQEGVAPETNQGGEAAPSSTVNVFPSGENKGHYGLSDPEANPYKPLPVDTQQEQLSGDMVSDDEKYHDAQEEHLEEPATQQQQSSTGQRSSDSFRSSSTSGKAPVEDANISRSSDDIREDSSVPFEASEPVQLDRIAEAPTAAGTNEASAGGTKAVSFEPIKLNPVNVTSGSSTERTPVTDTEPESRHEQPSAFASTSGSTSGSTSSAADTYTADASKPVAVSDAPHPLHAEAMTQALEEQEMQLQEQQQQGESGAADSSSSSSGAAASTEQLPHPPHAEAVSELLQQQEQELQAAQEGGQEGSSSSSTSRTVTDAAGDDGSTIEKRAIASYTVDGSSDTSNLQEVDLDSRSGGTFDDASSFTSVERSEQVPSTAAVTASPAPNARELSTTADDAAALAAPPAVGAAALQEPASPAEQAPTATTVVTTTEADEDTSNESDDEPEEQPTQQVPAIGGGGVTTVSKGDAAAGIRRTIRDSPADVKAKVDELDAIREFEAKRTSYYQNQIRSHTIYWVAMKEMIQRRGHVTENLLKWYNKRLTVYRHFAEGLFARNDSMAGDKKGASLRTAQVGDPFSSRVEPLQQKHYKQNSTRPLGAAGAAHGAGALQDELCAMDCDIATLVEQMCTRLDKDVGQVLMQQHTDTLRETSALVQEGDRALSTLDQVETYTLKAYETRHRTAAESMVRPTEYMDQSQPTARRDSSGDMWLADTNYRVAVAQQKAAWDNVATLMSRIFAQLRDKELERRTYTRAALEEMLRVQSETWQKLPATHDPVFTCLSRIDVDPQRLEKDLKDETRMWASSEQAQAYNAPPVSELEGDAPPAQTNPEFITSLNDPLQSPFVLEAAVLKRKDKGVVKSSWLSTLVVLTSDHFLHMFDCPTLLPGTDAQEAFGIILPAIDPAFKFSADKDEKKVAVMPSQSLDLSSHMIGPRGKQTKAEHAMQFHIIEVQENSGFKRFIKSQSQHKCSLRTRSKAEMEHWMNLIASLCEGRAAGSGTGGITSQGSAGSVTSATQA